ncbi:MAG: aminoacetone oxidase family FAD-binding enzyme [Epsilonproteobacteria bacterium]|nr:aminoacetone oxidase family FAD-binding enzyme [Campylobacterota bacterium]
MGAGASALFGACRYKDKNIALIDKNPKIGAKLEISGGGKCNLTNRVLSYSNYFPKSSFVKEVLNRFSNKDLLNFLKQRGLNPVLRKENQYFCPKSSLELLNIFKKELSNIPIFLNHTVKNIYKEKDLFIIETDKNILKSEKVVISSGGLSFPKLGATDIAFKIAKNFGHTIYPLRPALVGFTVQKEEFWFKELSGISIESLVRVENKTFKDNILFTHKGISGPAILNASLYWERGKIDIDFLPNFDLNLKPSKKQISSILPLPKRFTKRFLQEISLQDKPIEKLSKQDMKKLKILKNYSFSPAGTFGFSKAEVTKGGIDLNEIDIDSMMSKKEKNLFFIGECLNATGELGGYNIQWAFSSAFNLEAF